MKSNVAFGVITALLIVFIFFCMYQTVKGNEKTGTDEREMFFRAKEAQLLADTRAYLTEEGFYNSGVTLTRVVDGEGNREYTITIHHGRIDRMEEEEREDLRKDLSTLCFQEDHCTFQHDFLLIN